MQCVVCRSRLEDVYSSIGSAVGVVNVFSAAPPKNVETQKEKDQLEGQCQDGNPS